MSRFSRGVLVAALAWPAGVAAAPPLFAPADGPAMRADLTLFRQPPGTRATLSLPNGDAFAAVVQSPRRHASGNFTWQATLAGAGEDGYLVTLTGNEAVGLFGTLLTPAGEYAVAPAGTGDWTDVLVTPVGPGADDDAGPYTIHDVPGYPRERVRVKRAPARKDDGLPTMLRVLVLHDAAARAGLTDAAWHAYVDNYFAITNEAFEKSGVRIAFELAGLREVAADAAASNADIVESMRAGGAPFGEVAAWRVAAAAHFVTLLRERRDVHGGNCGYAKLPSCGHDANCYTPRMAFAALFTDRGPKSCTVLAFAHELGHNLGSAHGAGAGTDGTFAYARAHENAKGATTVMWSQLGVNQHARFSSPDLDCGGAPCGVAELADNVRSLNEVRGYFADWIEVRDIAFRTPPPAALQPGARTTVALTYGGLIGDAVDVELWAHGERVTTLARGVPIDAVAVEIPAGIALAPGFRLRVAASHAPGVYAESGPHALVDAPPAAGGGAFGLWALAALLGLLRGRSIVGA